MMMFCILCDHQIHEGQGSINDTQWRNYHESCLRLVLSQFDHWGIEMLRHLAKNLKLLTGETSK